MTVDAPTFDCGRLVIFGANDDLLRRPSAATSLPERRGHSWHE